MSYKNLVIINNEKISKEKNTFCCDNIDIKSISEGLNEKFDVTLIARSSKAKRSHNISLENIKEYDQIYNPVKKLGPAYISWQVVLGFVSAVIWPTAITRALSIKSVTMVKKQYLWSSFSFLIRFSK